MAITIDLDQATSFDLVPKGDYEVVIKTIEEKTTQTGIVFLSMSLIIRNDVEQNCQNRYIFHSFWKRKEPTQADMSVNGYSFKWIMSLAKAAKLPNGKNYESLEELCKDLEGRVICVTVTHDTYNGTTREVVKNIAESKYPECKHVFKEQTSVSSDTIAKPAQEQFANSQQFNMNGFEEILSDGDVPF